MSKRKDILTALLGAAVALILWITILSREKLIRTPISYYPLSRTDFFPKGDSKRENRCELPRKYHSFRANWSVGSCGNGLEEDVEDYGGRHKLLIIYRDYPAHHVKRVLRSRRCAFERPGHSDRFRVI